MHPSETREQQRINDANPDDGLLLLPKFLNVYCLTTQLFHEISKFGISRPDTPPPRDFRSAVMLCDIDNTKGAWYMKP